MVYGVGRDISKELEDEKSLLIADKFFNMAFEMLIVGNEKHFVRINPAFSRILGYDQKEMNEIMYIDLTHPDDLDTVKSQIDKLLQGEPLVSYKSRIKAKNGEYKWIHFTATSDLQSGLIYVVARDITEEIKLEKEQLEAMNRLYENEEKLHLILENIGDGVIVANTNREILMANYMANELYEVADDSQISFNLTDHFKIFYPDERTVFPSQNLPIERALLGETTEDVDVVLWNPVTQTKHRVLISGRPLIDPENKVIAVVITFKDISKYKQMEAELKETESKYRRVIGFKKDEEENSAPKAE
jgi:PAS domain S-box-containing protein